MKMNNKKNTENFKAVDFFCGGGGMSFGLKESGIEVIAGIDIDEEAKETYEANTDATFVLNDITEIPSEYLTKKFGLKKNDDKLIFAGCSPCQYYSIIRSSKEKSAKTKDLLLQFFRFVNYYKPGYVLVENVPGIITNKDTVLTDFLAELQSAGYKCIKDGIVNMNDYGVPQHRCRFSLIATRLDIVIDFPEKDKKKLVVADVLGVKHGFPRIKAGTKDKTEFYHSTAGLNELNLRRIRKTKHNGGSRMDWKDDPELQLKCYDGKDSYFRDVYARLWWQKASPTITTKFIHTSNGRFSHPEEDRALSIREGATLQSFPKTFVFKTDKIDVAARLIGNAVPPEYAKRLGTMIISKQQ
jgi:DNA (cytosine-5)-methyltransferase 1